MTRTSIKGCVRSLRGQQTDRLLVVHTGHVLATLCLLLCDQGPRRLDRKAFFTTAYLALKTLQKTVSVRLHDSLRDPARYAGFADGTTQDIADFFRVAARNGDVLDDGLHLHLTLRWTPADSDDQVRAKNPLQVYANEAAPVHAIRQALTDALTLTGAVNDARAFQARMAHALFDDECRAYESAKQMYSQPRYAAINRLQTASESAEPYFYGASNTDFPYDNITIPTRPSSPRAPLGVLLVHGFLSSPAELKPLGRSLADEGYPVFGLRLPGHGTSPWDLRTRTATEWTDSLTRGLSLLLHSAQRVVVLGFSAGGTLALSLAASNPDGLAGVIPIAAPLYFVGHTYKMMLVPLLRRVDDLIGWIPKGDIDPITFRPNASEHPDINYAHMPLRAVAELRTLMRTVKRRLCAITCPTLVIQGDHDPVVAPRSAHDIFNHISSTDKRLHWVSSHRHCLVRDSIGDTHAQIKGFLRDLKARSPSP